MKKTITINLSGSIFSIDEDAYELLRNYLSRIESHFSDGSERADIMADIEARIAELFSPSGIQYVQAITIAEVKKVIETMGEPEDIADSADTIDEHYSSTKSGRRIYRDIDRRILGGVCSGMAAYMALDVIWIRILFVILGLAFFSGILVYILLWIVIPPARTTTQKLEMKGEPVNINNIGKAVKNEFDNVRKNLKI
jgi:phage shock protein PspC (stress-responsive transcriptional regulator)